jgi:hypothetical protein
MLKALGATGAGGTGTVTSVGTGTGLTGGPITTSGTISLANTTVTAGTYGSNANAVQIIVNAQGQITNSVNVAIVIANSSVTGLGSMSYQNANAVTITGGTLNNTVISNVNVTSVVATFPNSYLTNPNVIIGSTTVALGSNVSTLGNVTLTSVTISSGNGTFSNLASSNVSITGGTINNATISNVTISNAYGNFTTVNVAFGGASNNIGSLSVGGFQNITADTGIIASFTGNSTTYSYTSLQNKNSSATAYGSYSLYNDTGTAYGDIGITSSTYNYATAGYPNNAFSGPSNLFVQAGSTDLALGTFAANAVHIIANGNVSITDGITVTSNNRVAIQFEIATKNNTYTLTTTDYTILANANTTPFTLTLPSASTSGTGRYYVIKKIDATANTVTISTTSSQTIDGATTYTINTAYSGVNLQSDGSNWWIIANLNGRNGTAGTF